MLVSHATAAPPSAALTAANHPLFYTAGTRSLRQASAGTHKPLQPLCAKSTIEPPNSARTYEPKIQYPPRKCMQKKFHRYTF